VAVVLAPPLSLVAVALVVVVLDQPATLLQQQAQLTQAAAAAVMGLQVVTVESVAMVALE